MSVEFPTDAEAEAVREAVAVHVPELVALAPDGVSEGQHLYCVQCGVLPVDALALQHGPEHVAEHVAIALAPLIAAREAAARRAGAAEALRAAADGWTQGHWADDLPPQGASRSQLILGMAQRAGNWLRDRADRIEADQ